MDELTPGAVGAVFGGVPGMGTAQIAVIHCRGCRQRGRDVKVWLETDGDGSIIAVELDGTLHEHQESA